MNTLPLSFVELSLV